jgi:ubiquinone/menaquinone biosynthesis C-methylase UbiE
MSPSQALALLSPAFPDANPSPPTAPAPSPSRWADLGSGSGLFTTALASLLPPHSTIYAIDRNPSPATRATPSTPTTVSIQSIKADFVKTTLPLPELDGILMANSLHYVRDKTALIRNLQRNNLRPRHNFIIIEYDTDRPTPIWVPYPISFTTLQTLFKDLGYQTITRLAEQPSVYNRNLIYSALITD